MTSALLLILFTLGGTNAAPTSDQKWEIAPVAFSADQTAAFDGRHFWHRHDSPFWTPTPEQVQQADSALLSSPHWPKNLRDPLTRYGRQYFGITDAGRRLILLYGFAPHIWQRDEHWRNRPVFVLDACRAFFWSTFDPTSGEFSSFHYSSCSR